MNDELDLDQDILLERTVAYNGIDVDWFAVSGKVWLETDSETYDRPCHPDGPFRGHETVHFITDIIESDAEVYIDDTGEPYPLMDFMEKTGTKQQIIDCLNEDYE